MVEELASLGAPPAWLATDTLARCQAALVGKLARENWKYSPLSRTLQMLLGMRPTVRSPLRDIPEGVSIDRLGNLDAPPPIELDVERYPLAGITACIAGDGWLIDIVRSPPCPIVLDPAPGINAPVLLRVHAGCRVEIEESAVNPGVQSAVRVLLAARDSQVRWAAAELGSDAEQWLLLEARLAENAGLDLHQHAAGAVFRRLDTHVNLQGAGSSCQASGASVVCGGQHLDRQLVVEHIGRNTTSRSKLHNLAAGRSRCSFNGRIHIHPDAAGADADLSNRNLALDGDAEINTKPELEIYTDDVRCAHGATVGQLDDSALFYLRSRGLSEPLAQRHLSIGFLAECIQGPLADSVLANFLGRLDEAGSDTARNPRHRERQE